jgi:septum formation protein
VSGLDARPLLILASGSPRRRELLAAAGFRLEIRPVEIDEGLRPGEPPASAVLRLARAKARAAFRSGEDPLVLAADTLVAIGGEIFGKPADPPDARRMLRRLSGRVHQVVTGWCLMGPLSERDGVTTSEIRFRDLEDSEIERYLALGESLDKAGAYAIQGGGVFLADWIRGSYPNIVGLPLAEVKAAAAEMLGEPSGRPGREG